jgi:catechol 2,3-dioxygenase-like lactoylglutathione lyase family enzyme
MTAGRFAFSGTIPKPKCVLVRPCWRGAGRSELVKTCGPPGLRTEIAIKIMPTERLPTLPFESAAHPSVANPSFGFPSRDATKAGITTRVLSYLSIRSELLFLKNDGLRLVPVQHERQHLHRLRHADDYGNYVHSWFTLPHGRGIPD